MTPSDAPYGNTGEDDMDAPGMASNMRPTSMPPRTGTAANSPKDNLDFGHHSDANESLRLLGAGTPYMNKN